MRLKAQKRDVLGRKVKALRKEGKIPGVLYGPNIETTPVVVDKRELYEVMREAGGSVLIDLEIEGKNFKVFIYDWQRDSLTEDILHVDFYAPELSEKVEVDVPLVFVNEAPAVKKGGTLLTFFEELPVRALPHQIPHHLIVDLSSLEEVGQELKVRDVPLPEGVEILKDPEEVLVKIVLPEREEIVEEEMREIPVSSSEEQTPSSSEEG